MLASRIVHLAQPVVTVKPMPVTTATMRQLPAVASVSTTALATAADTNEEGELLPMPVRRSAGVWRWAAAALLVGSLGFISYFSVIRPGEPLQSSLNPASLFRVPSFLAAESASNEVAEPVKPAIVAIAPVAKPVATPIALPVAEVKSPEIPAKETVVATNLVVAKPLVKRISASRKPAVSIQPQAKTNFTVIAGSFANRRNAVRFQKRLVRSGYPDAYILNSRGLIKVAAIGAESLAEAQAGIDSLKALTGITPWIMH
jgi:hypothetical protein